MLLERYQLGDKIAEGGMGVVYKAIDTISRKVVAVKTLKESINKQDETFLRFKKEAEVLESLNHPNILKFIDFQEQDGLLYIITEFVQGNNLKNLILSQSLNLDQKTQIICQIADALDYVHSSGIIHRDIKPSNIMVNEELEVKILDFGVANMLNFQKLFSLREGVAGSFAYMSPEQGGILKRNIDARSDLYSLGILFYELMTHQLPYQAKEVGELLHQHIARMPKDPAILVKDLSPILNKIILKLIKKDPDDRYQTSFGLAEDLKLFYSLSPEQKKTFYLELGKKDRLKNLNYRTGLIGRKTELKSLLNHLNDTVLNKGFLSVVLGKSGSGKSRLLSEVQKYVGGKNAFYVNVVSSESSQNHPYHPLIEGVKKILDLLEKLPLYKKEEIYKEIKTELGSQGTLLLKMIPELSLVLGEAPKEANYGNKENDLFLEKLFGFYKAVGQSHHPLVMVFDDAHFWDSGSTYFLKHIKGQWLDSGVYFIFALRDDEVARVVELHQYFVQLAQEGQGNLITLQNFSVEETQDLLNEIFGIIYNRNEDLALRLYNASQGNVLLLIENIKALVEEKIIDNKNEGWIINQEQLLSFRFSSSIADKILSRLSKLSSKVHEILSYAAILGKDFQFILLYNLLQKSKLNFSQEDLLLALQKAKEAQLIVETFSEKGEIVYSFTHDKVIETLILKMGDKSFKKAHRLAAQMIEENYHAADRIYKLAYHYLTADRRSKAYEFNILAAKEALDNFSYKLAVNFFLNALEIIKKFAKETKKALTSRIDLSLEVVNLNFQLGEFSGNIQMLEDLIEVALKIDKQEALAKIHYFLGKNYYFIGNHVKAMEHYYKVIPIAEALHIPELLGVPYCAIGRAYCFIANFKEAVEYIVKGLKYLPPHEELEQVYSLGILAQSYAGLGKKQEALDQIEKLKSQYGTTKDELASLYVLFFTASVSSMVGNPFKAVKEAQETYEKAKSLKNIPIMINTLFSLGRSYTFIAGKNEESIKALSKAVALAKEHKQFVGLFSILFALAENYLVLGNNQVAQEIMEEGSKYVGLTNPNFVKQWKMRFQAMLQLTSLSPNLYEALELIEQSLDAIKAMGEEDYCFLKGHSLVVKGAILYKLSRPTESEACFKEGKEIFTRLELENDLQFLKAMQEGFAFSQTSDSIENIEISLTDTQTYTLTATQTEFSYQRQLKYLLKLSEQLAQVHEMEALLNKIMALAIEVSGAERGLLFLYDNPEKLNSSYSVRAQKSIDESEAGKELAYSALVLENTLTSGKGQLIMDAQKELEADVTVTQFSMKSVITVPLMISGKVLGAIYLDNRQVKGLFTEENFELLKAFAIEAAISIENAKLYKQVQEQARAEQEMQIARDIQTSILPFIKENEDYEIAAFMQTADEVGGDYYDFYFQEPPYFGVFGDVSGHGLKSGLIMMMAEVAFNTLMGDPDLKQKDLSFLYQLINNTLYQNIQERLSKKSSLKRQYSYMYMTFRMFRCNSQGDFEMFGNDHAEPFVCRALDGEIQTLPSTGFLLGIKKDAIMETPPLTFSLQQGDLLVLFSDGITEAKKEPKEKANFKIKRTMFGDERLHQVVTKHRHLSCQEIIEKVVEEVRLWMADQEDDITLMILKKK